MQAASRTGLLLAAAALPASCTTGPSQLAQLEAALKAQDSATAALAQWCAQRRLADNPVIRATRVQGAGAPPPAGLETMLALAPGAQPGYRHVRLSCGGTVLSQAHNWYVRERLSPAMNATLDGTDTPFGQVAAPLLFRRERLSSVRGRSAGCPPATILTHRALLRLPDGAPLALVVECYRAAPGN